MKVHFFNRHNIHTPMIFLFFYKIYGIYLIVYEVILPAPLEANSYEILPVPQKISSTLILLRLILLTRILNNASLAIFVVGLALTFIYRDKVRFHFPPIIKD